MNEFDPYKALIECTPNPLSDAHLLEGSEEVYQMVLPYTCCGWNRGFYLQPILLEFNFAHYAPNHATKSSFVFIAWRPTEFRRVTHPDGTEEDLPVLVAYLCVNRSLFPPRDHQNLIEWLESIKDRAKGIAHELLYADQYAKYFNPLTGQMNRPIEMPTVDQEDELLCPCHKVEALLHTVEQESGIHFRTEDDFLQQQTKSPVLMYYHLWLKERGVERDVCNRRTRLYLRSNMRTHHGVMEGALDRYRGAIGKDDVDALTVRRHASQGTLHWQAYLGEVRHNGCQCGCQCTKNGCSCTDRELLEHTVLLVNRARKKRGH